MTEHFVHMSEEINLKSQNIDRIQVAFLNHIYT